MTLCFSAQLEYPDKCDRITTLCQNAEITVTEVICSYVAIVIMATLVSLSVGSFSIAEVRVHRTIWKTHRLPKSG